MKNSNIAIEGRIVLAQLFWHQSHLKSLFFPLNWPSCARCVCFLSLSEIRSFHRQFILNPRNRVDPFPFFCRSCFCFAGPTDWADEDPTPICQDTGPHLSRWWNKTLLEEIILGLWSSSSPSAPAQTRLHPCSRFCPCQRIFGCTCEGKVCSLCVCVCARVELPCSL